MLGLRSTLPLQVNDRSHSLGNLISQDQITKTNQLKFAAEASRYVALHSALTGPLSSGQQPRGHLRVRAIWRISFGVFKEGVGTVAIRSSNYADHGR